MDMETVWALAGVTTMVAIALVAYLLSGSSDDYADDLADGWK